MWFTVNDSHSLVAGRGAGVGFQALEMEIGVRASVIFCSVYVLPCHSIPHTQEDGLQGIHLRALNTAVHVAPTAHDLRTFYIIVGHVHATSICRLTVDDHNFSMVAMPDVIDPRKAYGVELIDFYASFTQAFQMFTLERPVVGVVTEAIEKCTHFHSLLRPLGQEVEK